MSAAGDATTATEEPLSIGDAVRALRACPLTSLGTLVALAVAAGLLVAAVAARFPDVSVYDEPAHLDYVHRAEAGEVPRMGDRLSPRVVENILCRDLPADQPGACAARDPQPEQLGADGFQYEAQQPPVYYVVTGALRQVVALGPSDDLLLTARLTGAAWLFAGLLALWLALARLRVRPLAAATILAVPLVSPAVVYHSATVTNDAAVLLLGALAVHLLLDSVRRPTTARVAGWSGLAWVAVWTKPQILLAFVAMGVTATLCRYRPGRRLVPGDRWLVPLAAGAVSYVVWAGLVEARATVDPDVVLDALLGFKQTDQFPGESVIGQLDGLVGAFIGPTPLTTGFVAGIGTLLLYVIVATDLRAVLERTRASLTAMAGAISLLVTVLAGPAFTILFFVQWDVGDGPSPRYGLVLLPGMLLGLVDVTGHRRGRVLVQVLVVGLATALAVVIVNPTLRVR